MSNIMANLRIWQKSLIPLGLLAIVSVGTTLYTSIATSRISGEYDHLMKSDAKAALWTARLNETIADTSRLGWQALGEPARDSKTKVIADLAKLKDDFAQRLSIARAGVSDPADSSVLQNFEQRYPQLFDLAMGAARLSATGEPDVAEQLMTEKFTPMFAKFQDDVHDLANKLMTAAEARGDELLAQSGRMRNALMGFSLAGLVLSIGLGVWIAVGGIIRPVRVLTGAMAQLAQRDWTVEVPGVARHDELGAMAKAVAVFKDKGQEADRLAAAQESERMAKERRAARVGDLTRTFETKVGELVSVVSTASTELQSTAQSMTGIANETTQQATTVATAAEQASANVSTVAVAAEELSASITEITRQLAQSAKITAEAVDASRSTDGVVQALAEGAQKIGDVVRLISNIAGQTNLLALNATIEAARAGEAGKGFAVVASEVKGLAAQTAKATEQISQQVSQMQNATAGAVESIKAIGAKIDQVSAIATAIGAAMEEQGSATQEIARNVQQAAQGTQQVTSNITAVTEGANNTGAAATQVLGAARDLSRQAEFLNSEVNEFIAGVKAA